VLLILLSELATFLVAISQVPEVRVYSYSWFDDYRHSVTSVGRYVSLVYLTHNVRTDRLTKDAVRQIPYSSGTFSGRMS
jgi:hypothetical protein